MTEDQCEQCGDVGWVWYWEGWKARTWIPCPSCVDAGRAIPPKPELDPDEELDEVDDYIGWEEI